MRTVHRTGFTLIDVMITVVVIGILAAVALPYLTGHLEMSKEAAAQSSYKSVRGALDVYYQEHGDWPATLNPTLFVNREEVTMPKGWQMRYDPEDGDLDLLEVPVEDWTEAESVVVVE